MDEKELLELILAAHVRDIAVLERAAAMRSVPTEQHAQWRVAHPLTGFVPAALADLRAIRSLIASSPPPH